MPRDIPAREGAARVGRRRSAAAGGSGSADREPNPPCPPPPPALLARTSQIPPPTSSQRNEAFDWPPIRTRPIRCSRSSRPFEREPVPIRRSRTETGSHTHRIKTGWKKKETRRVGAGSDRDPHGDRFVRCRRCRRRRRPARPSLASSFLFRYHRSVFNSSRRIGRVFLFQFIPPFFFVSKFLSSTNCPACVCVSV